MALSLFLLPVLLTPTPFQRHFVSAAAASTSDCYKRDGTVQRPGLKWLPCDPAKDGPCCGSGDYCMSNGLCLGGIVNQYFTAQGCSSSAWSVQDCNEICNETSRGARKRQGEKGK
ncbi:uncharacterized protein PG986_005186 [Apiospora aurea]|uniref:Uncharacterized protein n=1 Tax=Apiospora aurea TaxID=335848 RepID=A0ABR1QH83_9PEZI